MNVSSWQFGVDYCALLCAVCISGCLFYILFIGCVLSCQFYNKIELNWIELNMIGCILLFSFCVFMTLKFIQGRPKPGTLRQKLTNCDHAVYLSSWMLVRSTNRHCTVALILYIVYNDRAVHSIARPHAKLRRARAFFWRSMTVETFSQQYHIRSLSFCYNKTDCKFARPFCKFCCNHYFTLRSIMAVFLWAK